MPTTVNGIGTHYYGKKNHSVRTAACHSRYFPQRPLFVLCVRRKSARWWLKQPDRDRDLVRQLSPRIELPGQVLVIAPYGPYSRLARKVMAVPNADVFRRNAPDLPSSVTLMGA